MFEGSEVVFSVLFLILVITMFVNFIDVLKKQFVSLIFSIVYLFSISLTSYLLFIISFLLLVLGLFLSSLSRFLRLSLDY